MAESAVQFAARAERHRGAVVRCPDCNETLGSELGVKMHKSRGACVPIPGARARLALFIASALVGRML